MVKSEYKVNRGNLKGLYFSRGKLLRCPNEKCRARNSPNAKFCWKCGVSMNG